MDIFYPDRVSGALLSSGVRPAIVISAKVIDVNLDEFTMTVASLNFRNPYFNIPFLSPYQHYANGEGIYFMPEVGSICWLCLPSEGGKPIVMGWGSLPQRGSNNYRGKKQALNPGDIYLGTRDENFLALRRGGVVQIGGGPLSQRIFLPVNNTIKDFCENYGLHTIGGDLEWTVQRSEETPDGSRPTTLKITARQFANDAQPVAQLQIGSHDGGGTSILSLIINESGSVGATKKIELTMGTDGSVNWNVIGGDFTLGVDGNVNTHSTQDTNIGADKNISMTALQQVTIQAQQGLSISSLGDLVDIQGANGVNVGPTMTVGPGGSLQFPVMLASQLVLFWMANHGHGALGGVLGAGPPLLPFPEEAAVSSVLNAAL